MPTIPYVTISYISQLCQQGQKAPQNRDGVTKPIFSVLLFPIFSNWSKRWLPVWYPIHIWQVSLQLSCGNSWQIWMWLKVSNLYFCKIKISHNPRNVLKGQSQISRFMGPTWGPPGSCWPQMGPMLAPWTLLSGVLSSDNFWVLHATATNLSGAEAEYPRQTTARSLYHIWLLMIRLLASPGAPFTNRDWLKNQHR